MSKDRECWLCIHNVVHMEHQHEESLENEATTDIQPEREAITEKLAAIEHERWADWQKWMHGLMGEMQQAGKGTGLMALSKDYFDRWERQIATPYNGLTELEKQSDRDQVMRYWPIIEELLAAQRSRICGEIKAWAPKDVEVETPGYEPPEDPLVAADQAFNHANKQWRKVIEEVERNG